MSQSNESLNEIIENAIVTEVKRQNLAEEKDVAKLNYRTLIGVDGILCARALTKAIVTAMGDASTRKDEVTLNDEGLKPVAESSSMVSSEISDTNSVAVDMAMVRFNILYCLTNELSGYNDQQMSHLAKELCEAVRPYVATRERESITLEAAARILARDDGETDEYESLEWHKYVKAARTLLIAAGVSYAE